LRHLGLEESGSLYAARERVKVVCHGRYVTFRLAEIAVSRQMFADIPMLNRPTPGATGVTGKMGSDQKDGDRGERPISLQKRGWLRSNFVVRRR
jgi:hypothetical protein